MHAPDVPAVAGASSAPQTTSPPASGRQPAAAPTGWSVVLLVLLGTACLIAVVPTYRHGVATHLFPSYVRDDPDYLVQRFSAPWIAGSLALGGAGLICWWVAVGRLLAFRRPAVAVVAPVGRTADPDERTGASPRTTEAAREY